MLLFFPQAQANSKRYWKRAMNLSLPLLFAKNSEKNMEKLLVLTKMPLVIYLVMSVVLLACLARFSMDAVVLKVIDS